MLLPLQGAPSLGMGKPRALPWAKCFWAFSPRQLMHRLSDLGLPFGRRFPIIPRQLMRAIDGLGLPLGRRFPPHPASQATNIPIARTKNYGKTEPIPACGPRCWGLWALYYLYVVYYCLNYHSRTYFIIFCDKSAAKFACKRHFDYFCTYIINLFLPQAAGAPAL